MVKISLIIPSYNTPEDLYRNCLESVINLEGANEDCFEAIVIDDGATDNTPEIAEEYAKSCPFLRVIRQENGGNSVARNLGIRLAAGEYVAFLDCDDTLFPNFLLNALRTIRTCNDVYEFNFVQTWQTDVRRHTVIPHSDGFEDWLHLQDTFVYCWTKLIRKEFLIKNDIWFPTTETLPRLYEGHLRNYIRGEDNWFCCLILSLVKAVVLVGWVGVNHVERDSSLGHRANGKRPFYDDPGLLLMHIATFGEAKKRGLPLLELYAYKLAVNTKPFVAPKAIPEEWEERYAKMVEYMMEKKTPELQRIYRQLRIY